MKDTSVLSVPRMLPITVGALTETGRREENQDNMTGFMSPFGAVYLVADGMGGHKGGAEASRMIADGFRGHLLQVPAATPPGEALAFAARATNLDLIEVSRSGDPSLAGMGSTIAVALIRKVNGQFEVVTAHVGDSRVYRHHARTLIPLTKDHTQVQPLVDRGLLDEEAARVHPDASKLTRAMGQTAQLSVDVSAPIPLEDGDGLLLCSDGLSGFVDAESINQTIVRNPEPTACVEQLVQLALASGSNDNITVQFLRIGTPLLGVAGPVPSAPDRKTLPDGHWESGGPPRKVQPGVEWRKQFLLLAAGLAVGLVAGGSGMFWWLHRPPVAATGKPALRLEGSTTIGNELAPKLLGAFLTSLTAQDVQKSQESIDSAGHLRTKYVAKLPGQAPQEFIVEANESDNAFKALADGRADIGMSSRPINEAEVKKLSKLGNMQSACCEYVLALDAISIVVNSANSVVQLTKEQLADIYRGKIPNWAVVGGTPGPIKLYGRDNKSGTYHSFVSLVLENRSDDLAKNVNVEASGDAIAAKVISDPSGIGYVGLTQANGVKELEISEGPGKTSYKPGVFTAQLGTYPLFRKLYLYVPEKPSPLAKAFVDFATGPAGRKILKEAHAAEPQDAGAPPDPNTASLVKGKHKHATVPFMANSIKLEEKAKQEIENVLKGIERSKPQGIVLLGFVDHTEKSKGCDLADQRANAVLAMLKHHRLTAASKGICVEGKAPSVEMWVPTK